jgi:hypothetical protein
MPSGAPPMANFPTLSYADIKDAPSMGKSLQGLGKNLASAKAALAPTVAPQANIAPGATVPDTTVAAGGPQGPPPLPGQQGLPGSPYSPQYGPAAPPPGQQSILSPQQAGLQQPPVQLPTPVQPYPFNPQTSPLGQLNPINWMNMIRASLNQPGGVPMSPQQAQLPGSAIMQGAGILPGSQGFGG